MSNFVLKSGFSPKGDQPKAIQKLLRGLKKGYAYQTLLGVTGSGKTFTLANVLEKYNVPVLVLAHNKTLAAQLYQEFCDFFPHNAVEYFVSYYDFYQPEAYLPVPDTFIEKETSVNAEIERLRNSATSSLVARRDVIVVASVSCIYGLGSPKIYSEVGMCFKIGEDYEREKVLLKLIQMQYERSKKTTPGFFRWQGDVLQIFPSYEEWGYCLSFWGDTLENIKLFDPFDGSVIESLEQFYLSPSKHFLTAPDDFPRVLSSIRSELKQHLSLLRKKGKDLEAKRLEQRTLYDLEMLEETGYCSGIENYSRHIDGRKPGEPPYTLLDYFPDNFLLFVDESHMTLPQVRAMYKADLSRKENLIQHGFRLPSAKDNRPLRFQEFMTRINQAIFVSATPTDFEISKSKQVVEQIIRPTGLLDPKIEVRKKEGQIEDLYTEITKRKKLNERVLITTLTKRMAEELAEYLIEMGIKACYLHSEIKTIERVDIINDLRKGKYEVLVGVNLLREGLDLPEVSLLIILDADKEGFLRSERALIQNIGRVARHLKGKVIMYANEITNSMEKAMSETERRRKIQHAHNQKYQIVPRPISKKKTVRGLMAISGTSLAEKEKAKLNHLSSEEKKQKAKAWRKKMLEAATNSEFETAAFYRDQLAKISDDF